MHLESDYNKAMLVGGMNEISCTKIFFTMDVKLEPPLWREVVSPGGRLTIPAAVPGKPGQPGQPQEPKPVLGVTSTPNSSTPPAGTEENEVAPAPPPGPGGALGM